MKIYIVMGNCGEYSDYREWLVRAFHKYDKAIEYAEKCKKRAAELEVLRRIDWKPPYRSVKGKNEFDPKMETDYTGTDYTVEDMELDNE